MERQKREREAAAFLSSLGPNFEKARSTSPGPGRKVLAPSGGGGAAVNGTSTAATTRHVVVPSPGGGATVASVTVSAEVEKKRQEALQRLKATHCSVNHEKVILVCQQRTQWEFVKNATQSIV